MKPREPEKRKKGFRNSGLGCRAEDFSGVELLAKQATSLSQDRKLQARHAVASFRAPASGWLTHVAPASGLQGYWKSAAIRFGKPEALNPKP